MNRKNWETGTESIIHKYRDYIDIEFITQVQLPKPDYLPDETNEFFRSLMKKAGIPAASPLEMLKSSRKGAFEDFDVIKMIDEIIPSIK